MNRIKLFGAVLLIMMMGAIHARGAAPALPPGAIAADTMLVIHLDSGHFTSDQILAARTVLGDTTKTDEEMKQLKEHIDKAVAAGAEALTMVIGEPDSPDAVPLDESPVLLYVQLKAGADVKAIEAALTWRMSPADKTVMVFDVVDHFLVMHDKRRPFPLKSDPERAALFAEALETISDASIRVIFIPDPRMRELLLKMGQNAPKGVKEAVPQFVACRWTTLGFTLGNAPSFSLTFNAAGDADAKSLTDNLNAGVAVLKALMAGPNPNPALAFFDALKPVRSGTKVSISAKTDALKLMMQLAK